MSGDGDDRTPFIGVRPYSSAERGLFFGRAGEQDQIRNRWLSNKLLVVYGSSGVGKTSLLNAGAIPSLARADAKFRAQVLPLGRLPRSALLVDPKNDHSRPNPYQFALLSSWAPAESAPSLVGRSLKHFLEGQPEVTDEYDDPLPLLGAVDQFEELFTDGPHRQRQREEFLVELADAAAAVPRFRLLISIREEYLAQLIPYEGRLGGVHRARFRVDALGRDAALAAVVGPVGGTGRAFGEGVAERLVDDLRTATITDALGNTHAVQAVSVEPMYLQVVCAGLWSSLPAGLTTITDDYLPGRRDVDRLLREFCQAVVRDVARQFNVDESDIWSQLSGQFITEGNTRGIVFEGVTETGGIPNEVVRELEARRILTSAERLRARWYELQHDRLIRPVQQGAEAHSLSDRVGTGPSGVAYLHAAEAALSEGRLALAEDYAIAGARLDGVDLRTRAELLSFAARMATGRGDAGSAESHHREAAEAFALLQDDLGIGRVRADLGRLYYAAGDNLHAVVEFNEAVRLLPGDLSVKLDLARVLRDDGQLGAAVAMLGAALVIAPDLVEALVERGLIERRRGNRREARADLENAIRLRPEIADREDVRRALDVAG